MNNHLTRREKRDFKSARRDKYERMMATKLSFIFEPQEIADLVDLTWVKKVRANEILFHKGDEGRHLYAILKGRIQISTISAEGKEFILKILEPDELFGEISIIDSKERTATAAALETSELLVIYQRDLMPILERRPKVIFKMLNVVCERLRHTDALMESALFESVPFRLAKKLLTLAKIYGETTSSREVRISLKLSQTQLANMVGSSRESVNKQLRDWEDQRLIRWESRHIVIYDCNKLERVASQFPRQ